MSDNKATFASSPEAQRESTAQVHSHEALRQNETGPRLEVPVSRATEYVENAESAEIAGEVSEILQSKKEGASSGGATKSSGQKRQTPAEIKAQLLKKAPSENVMKLEIKREINKEIKYLHKRARKIMRHPGQVNAFELNNMVKKIRELKNILLNLARAVIQTTKTLWLRFVHGVM